MAIPPTVSSTTGNEDCLHLVSLLYREAFQDDPIFTYVLDMPDNRKRTDYLYTYFRRLLKAATLNGGIFHETDGFGCATCSLPPGKRLDNPWTMLPAGLPSLLVEVSPRATYRMLFKFSKETAAAKKKALGRRDRYWYLFSIATSPNRQSTGLGGVVMRAVQARAKENGLPIWLESTTERSMRFYSRHGFELVGEAIQFGVGSHDENGRPLKGGNGVKLWPMIWRPRKAMVNDEKSSITATGDETVL